MRRYVKFFEEFKQLKEISKFYKIGSKTHIDSLLKNGLDWRITKDFASPDSLSQGGGIYFFDTEETTIAWAEDNAKNDDLLIEVETELNPDYFEVDTELMNFTPETKSASNPWKIFWGCFLKNLIKNKKSYKLYLLKIDIDDDFELEQIDFSEESIVNSYVKYVSKKSDKSVKNILFVLSKDNLKKEDIKIKFETHTASDTISFFSLKSDKNIAYFSLYSMNGGNQTEITKSLESIKNFDLLIYKDFNSELLTKSSAFRYKGPIIKNFRYKLKDKKGNWGNWKSSIDNQ